MNALGSLRREANPGLQSSPYVGGYSDDASLFPRSRDVSPSGRSVYETQPPPAAVASSLNRTLSLGSRAGPGHHGRTPRVEITDADIPEGDEDPFASRVSLDIQEETISREEAEAIARKDAERRRRRRESDIERPRSYRDSKSSSNKGGFSLFRTNSDGPIRASNYRSSKSSSSRHDDEGQLVRRSTAPRETIIEEPLAPVEPKNEAPPGPSSSQDSSSHRRHRHHRHRTEGERSGDRPEHRRRESDRKEKDRGERSSRKAPAEPQKKSFFGSLLRAF